MKRNICAPFIFFIVACGTFFQCTPVIPDETHEHEKHSTDASTQEKRSEKDTAKETDCKEGAKRSCYTGPSSTQGIGVCKPGLAHCTEGRWTSCIDQMLPTKEICGDNKDNDCDGQTDEECGECTDGERRGCYESKKGCTVIGSTYSCKTPCKAGTQICTKGQWETSCTGQQGPTIEVCDKKDNDCDGKVDNIKEQGNSCDTGELGACKTGKIQCSPFGKKICKANNKALPEICDGKDNDCDGKVDEELIPPDCSKRQGACKDAKKICEGVKGWKDCTETEYTKNNPSEYEVKETRCDGIDNDCDGATDIGCACKDGTKAACYNIPIGCNKTGSKYTCKGPCRTGIQTCKNGKMGACIGAKGPQTELCNGKDDDCDGKVDNNLSKAPVCRNQKGLCKGAVKACGGTKGWLPCTNSRYAQYNKQIEPVTEKSCDGLDNDCDGQTDETFTEKDKPCTTSQLGECKTGRWSCVQGKKTCTNTPKPKPEICNGKDDDCDGLIDERLSKLCPKQAGYCKGLHYRCEGLKGWQGCTAQDYKKYHVDYQVVETKCDGSDNDCDGQIDNNLTAPKCKNQRSDCLGAVKRCGGLSGWLNCTAVDYLRVNPDYEVAETKCDGKDNDCDGQTDETYGNDGKYCDTGQKGECKAGKLSCSGSGKEVCIRQNAPKTETCNGKDDDCDGQIDNNLTAPLCTNQKGVCQGIKKFCGGASGWVECTPTNLLIRTPGYQHPERRCDGLDNDCDGKTDIGCVSTFAGSAGSSGFTNGIGNSSRFNGPTGLALDTSGNLYVADTNNNVIRRVDASGRVSTFLGPTGTTATYTMDSEALEKPKGLHIHNNHLYIAMSKPSIIVKINLTTGSQSSSPLVNIDTPQDVVVGAQGLLYVSDSKSSRIRKSSITFTPSSFGNFISPIGDPAGLTYNPIQKWLYVSTYDAFQQVGEVHIFDYQGGPIQNRKFDKPRGMAISGGKLYVVDEFANGVYRSDTDLKNISLFTGKSSSGGTQNGYRTNAAFNAPWGIAFSSKGDMYISDTGNHTIRKIKLK